MSGITTWTCACGFVAGFAGEPAVCDECGRFEWTYLHDGGPTAADVSSELRPVEAEIVDMRIRLNDFRLKAGDEQDPIALLSEHERVADEYERRGRSDSPGLKSFD